MPQLFKKKGKTFIGNLIPAQSLKQRIQGLTVYSELQKNEVFWIPSCPSIHTFFMKFPIDVVFTDSEFKVLSLFSEVQSGRILFGGLKSRNVFEMKIGQILSCQLSKGESLYVEP
ncbi:MAG: DUF192 domain-containing protein [Bdellovibrionaceae bacterium]|nr:DUF192 domain-containing protein [Pseudobdellovibrionaceae bacterium]